ncbi:lipase [Ceratobasidium sp. AG-I]|nr:lipase [Ceratobasidium sp. AG-I]
MHLHSGLVALAALVVSVLSAPAPSSRSSSSPVTPLNQTEIDSYIPYEWFAAATYCPQPSQASWTCASCQADPVKDFQVYKSGGDGGLIQYWYVGWWPSGQSVIVAHEGTELNDTAAVLTDALLVPFLTNPLRFPGAPLGTTVHAGFQAAHARTASTILTAVKEVIAKHDAKKVVSVGHSLGGALALLEGLHLRLQLPSNITVVTRTFGQPRVGNVHFAEFVDNKLPDLARVTNKRDNVPTVPSDLLGLGIYAHSNGEKHINAQGVWNDCSGHDNPSIDCSAGQVKSEGKLFDDHLGPYAGGVRLGTDNGALC